MKGVVEWFRDPGIAEFLTFLVAVCALFVSIWAVCSSKRANRKATETQARLLGIEEQRDADRLTQARQAALRAALRSDLTGGHCLHISNRGRGAARRIQILMDGKPLDEHPAVHSGVRIPEVIEAGSEISRHVFTCDSNPPFEVEITWEDDSNVPGRYQTTLTP
jgi:hypothetical protein